MIKIKCKECGKVWTGPNEHTIEVSMNNPNIHPCAKKAKQMSMDELLKKIKGIK
jgi:hypothetical protein